MYRVRRKSNLGQNIEKYQHLPEMEKKEWSLIVVIINSFY